MSKSIKIALAGNPNSGKTTLFNALTGSEQYVGNWPGVTVEKKDGILSGHKDVVIQDLPGIYSLSPYSIDDQIGKSVDKFVAVDISNAASFSLGKNLHPFIEVSIIHPVTEYMLAGTDFQAGFFGICKIHFSTFL